MIYVVLNQEYPSQQATQLASSISGLGQIFNEGSALMEYPVTIDRHISLCYASLLKQSCVHSHFIIQVTKCGSCLGLGAGCSSRGWSAYTQHGITRTCFQPWCSVFSSWRGSIRYFFFWVSDLAKYWKPHKLKLTKSTLVFLQHAVVVFSTWCNRREGVDARATISNTPGSASQGFPH